MEVKSGIYKHYIYWFTSDKKNRDISTQNATPKPIVSC